VENKLDTCIITVKDAKLKTGRRDRMELSDNCGGNKNGGLLPALSWNIKKGKKCPLKIPDVR